MIQSRLRDQLSQVAARYGRLRFWQTLSIAWLFAALAATVVWTMKDRLEVSPALAAGLTFSIGGLAAPLVASLVAARRPSAAWIAQQVERAFPELRTCLLAAVEQRPELLDGRLGYLQSNVIREALDHAQAHAWVEIVPAGRIALARGSSFVSLAVLGTVLAALALNVSPPAAIAIAPRSEPPRSGPFSIALEPGNVEVEKGTSLLVLARVSGTMPADAELVWQPERAPESRLAMNASLADPIFIGRIARVEKPFAYRAELDGQATPTYRVTVFEYPRLERADANLVYPEYTALEPRLVQDVRAISVVEGTTLTLKCILNKPVASATLVPAGEGGTDGPLALSAQASEPKVYEVQIPSDRSRRLELALVDEAGRQNPNPVQFKINVAPNEPPSLKPVFPARDVEVSALEELQTKATVWDDFGVQRAGLTYALAGQPAIDVVLSQAAASRQKHEVTQAIHLEDLKAEPDQLVSYHWWAEDYGPDGQVRRTMSDMYFADVRPFEEIFRQGEQPPGGAQQQQQNQQGQGQNAQQAQELAKLQKDIINATWKLIRRETGAARTEAYAEDLEQVRLSQESALEKASALAEQVEDEQSQQHVDAVLKSMEGAISSLASAQAAGEPLKQALAAEQAAYQALLKLRAREHEVIRQERQQNQQSSSQSSARSSQQQQQLEQLDLREEKNRYETQRMAQEQQQETAQERENRQVLNRLRDLARRQHDMNERLKELQSALEEAQTEQEQEEIRRQLQRLEEEQRQILQDTDELQLRLDEPENRERMAEERQQLEETRDQVRRSSEALEQQQVTQAAASGTRAEKQFDDLREEFRRRTSERFTEELREMRAAAQQLEDRQGALSQQMSEADQPPERAPSLRQDDPRDGNPGEGVADQLAEQRQRLADLRQAMQQTIDEAQETEPLLSQKLYDTARNLEDRKVDQALKSAESSVRSGFADDAKQQEASAGEGIRQLRQEIDQAAESVLGDETEALRRARQELRDLADELNEEIERESPGDAVARANSPEQTGSDREDAAEDAADDSAEEEATSPGRGRPAGESTRGAARGGRSQPQDTEAKQNEREGAGQGQGQRPRQSAGGEQDGEPGGGGSQEGQQRPSQAGGSRPGGAGSQPGQEGEAQLGQDGDEPPNASGRTGRGERRQPGGTRGGAVEGGSPNERLGPGFAPLTGEDFRNWSDRLRDVEEMVDDPALRADAARIRERARAMRAEFKRHSAPPNWDLVREQVAGPLVELENRVAEELLRRTSRHALVPLERDAVPPEYAEKTRRYYEQLGSGK